MNVTNAPEPLTYGSLVLLVLVLLLLLLLLVLLVREEGRGVQDEGEIMDLGGAWWFGGCGC